MKRGNLVDRLYRVSYTPSVIMNKFRSSKSIHNNFASSPHPLVPFNLFLATFWHKRASPFFFVCDFLWLNYLTRGNSSVAQNAQPFPVTSIGDRFDCFEREQRETGRDLHLMDHCCWSLPCITCEEMAPKYACPRQRSLLLDWVSVWWRCLVVRDVLVVEATRRVGCLPLSTL